MDRNLGRTILGVAVAALLCGAMPALAQQNNPGRNGGGRQGGGGPGPRSVPEFDPTTVGAIVAILVGGGALLARRRR